MAGAVYVTDAQLWRIWQDSHDSARVSYVRFAADEIPDSSVKVSDAEVAAYFKAHEKDFAERPGRAVVTVAAIPRSVTAADSAKVFQQAEALRTEIESGKESFADAAKRVSADTASAADGGYLGKVTKGQFVEEFDSAAFSLKPGAISQPVLTPFGYHLIKVDSKTGDSIAVRHILLRIQQSDSSASVSDSLADALAKAASSDKPALFDSVTKALDLHTFRAAAIENEPLTYEGKYIPSVSAWAFTARPGETSDLIDGQDAYYVARLDSLKPGGKATLESESEDIRQELMREKKLDLLVPRAQKVSAAVASGETLEQAAKAAGLTVQQTPEFARTTSVPGLGQATQAVGAAFGLPKGAVSQPIKSENGVFVIRVDERVQADRAAWEKQKAEQRTRVLQGMRQQRVQQFLASLRENAKIEDRRKEIAQQNRQLAG